MTNSDEIWILGATGRTGRAIAQRLANQGANLVLVGRDEARLNAIGIDARHVTATDIPTTAAEITRQRPAVVINTIGEYASTAATIARAGFPGTHYVDLAADLTAVPRLLALHDEAAAAGSTLVTGVGFGVLATEAVVVALCAGRPTPRSVRVDALASVAVEAGTVGTALAASMIDALAAGGRQYANGQLTKVRIGAEVHTITLPDGDVVTSMSSPSGELIAAHNASNAPFVVATTNFGLVGPALRALLPLLRALVSIPAIRRLAITRIARTEIKAAPQPRQHSWGHAVIEWPDGTTRAGWLRAGEGMAYTAEAVAAVAARLTTGEAKPGAHTPAALFGPDLATVGNATLTLS